MYLLFADDIVFFSDTAEGQQKQISLFWGYCRLWQLIVSLPKSKVVIYNKGYAAETYEFKIRDDRLEICESYKYLGLWCSNSPNIFAKNYTYLSEQAKKALYAIKSYTTPSLGKLHPNLALKLFDSLISPILMYGSEILYNGREQNDFEKIHLSYLKKHAWCKKTNTHSGHIRRHRSFPSFAETTSPDPEILGSSRCGGWASP